MNKALVKYGIDQLLHAPVIDKQQRIGLLTNNAAVTHFYTPSREELIRQGFNVVKLFSPEHGLDTTGPDGHFMLNGTDTLTGLPVVSLYGEKLMPAIEDVQYIDVLLVDLPDIGTRFYTYLWTMTYVLEAAARYGKKVVILDRPNPISGDFSLAEGPLLDEVTAASFIGRWSVPLRHSCTLGELALYFNQERKLGTDLQVVPCTGWKRDMFYPVWGQSFVPASPAINGYESTLLYPGLCLLEATNVSEGRGTATPFRVAGAPWMNAREIAMLMNERSSGDAVARPLEFVPLSGRYQGSSCKGVMLHVQDAEWFRPVRTGLILIKLIRDTYPDHFEWAPYKTHVNGKGTKHLQLLLGQPHPEALFELDFTSFLSRLDAYTGVGDWKEKMMPYLISSYDRDR
ncbi:exo-beta-N-acetylmuramidase NamZ domain-containing protein [Chitinophaga sp. Cy-1792]|uniref:exo-beta-N-acetylmuramidase NamZ family protein n=1 Tax=Chitinophaga sp. Cy-1792 TaxID=2608339 RepID=UPI0014235950|nr:DUF1343 domain-containing protein [Chitinophaga sp. Cy-1792]NIG54471.1 DUF1343 domain-containing protein [Chitinophaga sp. Cy-1792]